MVREKRSMIDLKECSVVFINYQVYEIEQCMVQLGNSLKPIFVNETF